MDFAKKHKIGQWMAGRGWFWFHLTKINRLGSDGRNWAWKMAGEGLSNRLVEGTVKFGQGSVMNLRPCAVVRARICYEK